MSHNKLLLPRNQKKAKPIKRERRERRRHKHGWKNTYYDKPFYTQIWELVLFSFKTEIDTMKMSSFVMKDYEAEEIGKKQEEVSKQSEA